MCNFVCLLIGWVLLLPAFAQTTANPEQAAQATDKDDSKKKAQIEGKVINGVTGAALKKATVLLQSQSGRTSPISAETDDSGQFSLKDLAPGRYTLYGERQGFARQAYGARSNPLIGATIHVTPGQKIADVLFKMMPAAVISGKVTDEEGEPMNGATVLGLKSAFLRGKRQWLPLGAVQSNDMGEFRIPGLATGKYIISVTYRNLGIGLAGTSQKAAGDKPEFGYATTYYPSSTDIPMAAFVDVKAGSEIRGIDIRMTKVKAVHVAGKISGGDAQAKTVLVSLTPKGSGILGMVTRSVGIAQPPEGKFEIKGVLPGAYMLTVNGVQDQQTMGAGQTVQVGDQHIEGLVIPLGGGADIQGSVTIEGEAAGALAGMDVVLEAIDTFAMPLRTTLDENGKFTVKNVFPNRYAVTLLKGPETAYIKSIRFGDDAPDHEIELMSGAAPELSIKLNTGGATVEGSVVDKEGNAVKSASVALIPKSGRQSFYRSSTTDQSGRFSFKGVIPGEYKLYSWEDLPELEAFRDPDFVKQFESKAEKVTLEEKGSQNFRLTVISYEDAAAAKDATGK